MVSALPFEDFRGLLDKLPEPDEKVEAGIRQVFAKAALAQGPLGVMEDLAAWFAGWTGRARPQVSRPLVAIFAGTHGVAAHGVSPRPVTATAEAVELCAAGGAAINQVCLTYDLGLKVFDLALDLPTGDITREPALDERGCAATMAFGMEAIAGGSDLLCLGDMGVGNSTVAAVLLAALFGGAGRDWVGPGSGADEAAVARKAAIVDQALELHGPHLDDPLEALARVGGREFAAIAGAILAARMERIPVLIDGFAATAAAAALHKAKPGALDHCILASLSPEPGHRRATEFIGMTPLLDLGIGHGEGVGAALGAGLVKAAVQMASGMAAAQR
ncbi:nicotinate-nucleotide--dimethylbenzimidazole phosphoribosyltransferase [Aquamicrobium ahrensii]|uniref:Nicotinate-nucleotide--dimethylbenzimidazole phosphoribosyltransferase n=1 Tax=Aquamicrobium ahrensii TaxID=469551 RepID=A0ABV2KJF7_9HYPH